MKTDKKSRQLWGEIIKKNTVFLVAICLYILITKLFGIGCPILYLFKVPCPTCGVTRAMMSLLVLDFKGYFNYNFMALPLCVAVLLLLNIDVIKYKKLAYAVSGGIIIINLVVYVFNLIA